MSSENKQKQVKPASNRYWVMLVALKLGIASTILYLVMHHISTTELRHWLQSVALLPLIGAFIIFQLSVYASALRSRYYFECHGLTLRKHFMLRLYYVGMLFNIITPGGIGGDGYKVYALWKLKKFPRLQGVRLMFYERVNGVFLLCCIAAILLPLSSFWPIIYQLLPLSKSLYAVLWILLWPAYLLVGKHVLRDRNQDMLGAALYSAVGQTLQMIMATLLVLGLEPNIQWQQICDYVFLFAVSSVVAIIPISIGGAGLRELTFLLGLNLIGATNRELGIALAMLVFSLQAFSSLIGLPLLWSIIKSSKSASV